MSTSMKSKDLLVNFKTWRESITSKREESKCREKLSKDLNQDSSTKVMHLCKDLLEEVSIWQFPDSYKSKAPFYYNVII
jgi:hypothetical protein